MGYEYIAKIVPPLMDRDLTALAGRLKAVSEWKLIRDLELTMDFAFSKDPPRFEWPEDFRIVLTLDSCYLLFHGGASTRRGVQEELNKALGELGRGSILFIEQ